jgi:hypothetical protein
MKENKIIEMRNKVETLGAVVQKMLGELENLRDLSVGTLETLKRIPGYQEALDDLQKDFLNKKKTEDNELE